MTRARLQLFKDSTEVAVRGDVALDLDAQQDGNKSKDPEIVVLQPPPVTRGRRGRKKKDEANAFFQHVRAGNVPAAQTSLTELPLEEDVGADCDYWERLVPVHEALCAFSISFSHSLTKVPRIRHGGMIGQLLCICTEPLFVFIPANGRDAFVAAVSMLRGAPLRTSDTGKISLFTVTFRIITPQLVAALQEAGIRYILLCEYGMQARPLRETLQKFALLSDEMGEEVLPDGILTEIGEDTARVVHLDLSRNVLPTKHQQVDVFRFVRATDQAEMEKITWNLVRALPASLPRCIIGVCVLCTAASCCI